jgi:hypothetical protein
MTLLLPIAVGVALVAVLSAAFYLRRRGTHAKCSACGAASSFGYSRQAESDTSDVIRFCLTCLITKLNEDYRVYTGRALVVEPTADLPCYVFQPQSKWPGPNFSQDLFALLASAEDTCRHCGAHANFLWVTSNGLTPSTFPQIFAEGPSKTVLQWGNEKPVSVCASCCLASIKKVCESRSLTFLEVCGPRSEDGIILPMAY